MKRYLLLVTIIFCLCALLISCASIITHKDTSEQTTSPELTTPTTSITTTVVTTPMWSIQTGNHIINSHSGYVMPVIYEKNINDKNGNQLFLAKILYPKAEFYDDEGLEATVNANIYRIFNEIEAEVNDIYNRYQNCDASTFLSTPTIYVDYSLEYFTKEAMSLKFQITETDNNAGTHKSFLCYNLDLTTGSIINATTVFIDSDLSSVSLLISEKLSKSGYILYADSSKLIEQFFQERWFIKFEELNLCFNPGEIAAISEGSIDVSINVKEIKDIINQYGSALFTVNYENN